MSNNLRATWTTREGVELAIADMETSHIENTIRMVKRKLPELDEETDYLTADGDGCDGVLVVYGARHYREKLKMLKQELARRQAQR